MNDREKAKAAVEWLEWTPTRTQAKRDAKICALQLLCLVDKGTHVIAPIVPTQKMWRNELVRTIVRWMASERATPNTFFETLSYVGFSVPEWLRTEPEMSDFNRVVSKGAQTVILYRAMIAAAKEGE
jgi:hypothetical protein